MLASGCQRETEIVEAHECEVVQVCFWQTSSYEVGTLLSIDSRNLMKQWDLTGPTPSCIKSTQLKETEAFCSCLTTPGFLSSDPANHDHAFIGMSSGDLYFYALRERVVLKHCVKRE